MSKIWKVVLSVCLFIYPIFIFLTLLVFEKDMRVVSLGMMIIGVLALILNFKGGNKVTPYILSCAETAAVKLSALLKDYAECQGLTRAG